VCHPLLRRDSGSSGAPQQAPRLYSGSDYARAVPLIALVLVTVVWGITFVQVKDAVAIYPLFAFLALRFAIGSAALLPFAVARARRSPWKRGAVVGVLLGLLVAGAYASQTAGLVHTTVSGSGVLTGLYVVMTPLLALILLRRRIEPVTWLAVLLAGIGFAMLSGIPQGSRTGNALVLISALLWAVQIVLMERYAPQYDPLILALGEMTTCLVCFSAIALVRGDLSVPHGWVVWGALLVTGLLASAFAFLVQSWAQQQMSAVRTAVVFALEPVFAAIFGLLLAGDRLGWLGWGGCAVIMGGIVLAEPAAARALRGLLLRVSTAEERGD
jgi:drug/metabolite transporter (DMT)-like permease